MSNHRYTSTGLTQQPARSILKPARSSHTTSAIPSSRPRSALPVVEVRDPSVPTQAAQRAIQSLQDVPLHGPIPAIYFPPTQNRQQLVELLNQFVIQLEADKEGGEEHERTKVPRLQAGRPTYESDEFPEFRQLLMGPWVAGPCYGPVLEPEVAMKLPVLQINRYLSPLSVGTKGRLHWDVTQPISSAKYIANGKTLDFNDFCNEPATLPRLTQFKIISAVIPWTLMAIRSDRLAGVTVGDVLSNLSLALLVPLTDSIVQDMSERNQTILLRAHQERCPKGGEQPKPYDLLAGSTLFEGLSYDRIYEKNCNFSDQEWEIHLLAHYFYEMS